MSTIPSVSNERHEMLQRHQAPALPQLVDLFLIELTNWRWSWRSMLITGTLAPIFSTLAMGVFARDSGQQVLAYVLAVEKANSLDSDKVRAALGELKFMSFYGGWDVDETGLQVGHSMVDVQWQAGKRVIVWPEEAQTGKPFYPMPTFAEKAKGKKAGP